ncbi:MAG: restriction endonuclease subunit S [Nitrospira sp.]|nr:restriction endonuclease subunit S [Nitrospira sp.]
MKPTVKLGPHISQVRGISFKPDEVTEVKFENSVPLLKANNITDDGLDDSSLIYINQHKIKPEQYIRAGDLLLAASSGSKKVIGKSVHFAKPFPGSFGAFCKVVRPKSDLYPEYLKHFFKTGYYRSSIEKAVQGANINNLRNEHLDALDITLSPLDDQKRIAHLLGKVEGLFARRKQHLQQINKLLKSVFLVMFGDPVRNEKGWAVRELGKVIKIKHGFAFKSEFFSDDGPFVLLTPGNFFEEGGFRDRGDRQKYYTGEIPQDYILDKGDLLLAMTEQAPGLLGSPLIVPKANLYLHNQRLGLVVEREPIQTRFLFHLFNQKSIRQIIHSKSTGTKVRHTSPTKLESIIVGYPPIDLQNQFAAIVEKVESLKSRYQQSLTDLEGLYGTLSQKAFKGELDLSRVPLPKQHEVQKEEAVEVADSEQDLPEEVKPTLENLNALNQSVARFKTIVENARLTNLDLPKLDILKKVAEQMAALQSPIQELKQMNAVAQEIEKAQEVLKPLKLGNMANLSKSADLARAITSALPKIDLGGLELHKEALRKTLAPFEAMRNAMAHIATPSTKLMESMVLAGETAKRLENTIPDFRTWQQQGTEEGSLEFDDDETTVKRPFTREDITAIFAEATAPLSFTSLLAKLGELESVDLSGYETIRRILFDLLEEQQITQDFDEENKLLLLMAPQ